MLIFRTFFIFLLYCFTAYSQNISDKEQIYKAIIRENLSNTIETGIYPCLGKHRSGKVRDLHYLDKERDSKIVMIISDRISAYNFNADRTIPFKGAVLNLLNLILQPFFTH